MSEKTREICTVVSQESIGAGIYSMWIQTDRIAADAKPGQFVSLYTNDRSKILPRPKCRWTVSILLTFSRSE